MVNSVKRQSTCELEADIFIDDILNQQLKIYSSLSQTSSDVRMVQSLIPIWEEEYERTGIQEEALPPDPGKPHPEDVLRVFSHGLEFEQKVLELCSKKEKSPSALSLEVDVKYQQSVSPSTNKVNELGLGDSVIDGEEAWKSISSKKDSHINLSQQLLCEANAASRMQNPDIVGSSHVKVGDREALGLLHWLAVSQVSEDIDSGDELVRETILSPLLPATTIDKVLEQANMDFESQSQQECQDILDSIEAPAKSDTLNDKCFSTDHNSACQISLKNMIPQVDDSRNVPNSVEQSYNVETHHESEMLFRGNAHQGKGSSSTHRRSRKKSNWGSLPFSSTQKIHGDKAPIEAAECKIANSENEEVYESPRTCSDTVVDSLCPLTSTSALIGCSTRDLMRQKRSQRFQCSREVQRLRKASPEKGKDPFSFPRDLEAHQLQNDMLGKRPLASVDSKPSLSRDVEASLHMNKSIEDLKMHLSGETCHSRPDYFEDLQCCKQSLTCNDGLLQENASKESTNFPSEIFENVVGTVDKAEFNMILEGGKSPENDKTASQCCAVSVDCCKDKGIIGRQDANRKTLDSPVLSHLINTGPNEVELSPMTFHRKPPLMLETLECTAPIGETYPFLNAAQNDSVDDPDNCQGRSAQGNDPDELLPFFMHDSLEEKSIDGEGLENRPLNNHVAVGIPTHVLNDGSSLYMLTPKVSPPSTYRVIQWTLKDGTECSLSSKRDLMLEPCAMVLEKILRNDLKSDMDPSRNKAIEELETHGCDAMRGKQNVSCSQDISQISGPDEKSRSTPLSQTGFRDPASLGGGQQLMILSIEIQAESRGDLRPDPRYDAINVVVLVFQEDNDSIMDVHVLLRSDTRNCSRNANGVSGYKVSCFSEEKHIFIHLINIIRSMDPDLIMGWDIQAGSLGFLAERALHLGITFINNISRTPSELKESSNITETSDSAQDGALVGEDEWGRTHASGVHVSGRVVLNIWRLMRGELKLNMYTLGSVAEAVLRQKVPFISSNILTSWFASGHGEAQDRCIQFVAERAKLNLKIMEQLDMINRTSELARVFGIDFFSVLSRGSQYRVESMMLRLAHTQNYLAISPGSQQVASQSAMECLPLVMEPESGFYIDPVVVLDFQSLYPSMIIAYNLCFSTCFGNVNPLKGSTLGVSSYTPDMDMLWKLKRELLVTPNGVMYAPSKVRRGILPRLLEEILSTRVLMKQAMKKLSPSEKVLHRVFNARQLALKLIANVTYGYTAAGFSGRMPCAELADSIVQCGRRTLEFAISFVNANDKWKARVIYGDTDSMFVLLKGRSVEEAFEIGNQIASAVSALNPNPVTLKMEKVYHPCFLLTKKRYVGYSYEKPGQTKPSFDAKGIETVRRDTCGAVAKTMEQSLKLFFEHQNVNKVRAYLERQWTRILSGRISFQDFIFAKEVRLGTYSMRGNSTSLPPAAIVATKAMRADPRAEPRYAERIPYVVVHGEPGSRLIDMVVGPMELMAIDSPYRLNDVYYITKQIIPALQRVFGLVGADLHQWFLAMPRPEREVTSKRVLYAQNSHRTRIDYYYLSKHCVLCGGLTQLSSQRLCGDCSKNKVVVATTLVGRTSKLEREAQHLAAICEHCGGQDWVPGNGVKCTSLACSVFYERRKVKKELIALSTVAIEAGLFPSCKFEWF
ncbi:DNA polymerase zeta catalytic subunit isoform X1 [Impatiens glandulifera]|nr:DNA polymerase zeta catalytic subunit isoform X1 [Impatiens glandulifera]